MPRYFDIVRLSLTTTSWTPVVCPKDCSVVKILNEDDVNTQDLRSDAGDSGSQMSLLPSATLVIDSPACAFERGTTVCSLRSQSGTGPIVAQFIR